MRRALTALGALLASVPCALALVPSASAAAPAVRPAAAVPRALTGNPPAVAPGPQGAAVGSLIIEGEDIDRFQLLNPAPGCYALPSYPLLTRVKVINDTDADVLIYSDDECRSGILHVATRVRAKSTSRRTLTGSYSLRVRPTWL